MLLLIFLPSCSRGGGVIALTQERARDPLCLCICRQRLNMNCTIVHMPHAKTIVVKLSATDILVSVL